MTYDLSSEFNLVAAGGLTGEFNRTANIGIATEPRGKFEQIFDGMKGFAKESFGNAVANVEKALKIDLGIGHVLQDNAPGRAIPEVERNRPSVSGP